MNISNAAEFIPALLAEIRRSFTDSIKLPQGEHRIYVLNEKEKSIRISNRSNLEPLFKWNGIYFQDNMIQHKFRVSFEYFKNFREKKSNFLELFSRILTQRRKRDKLLDI